MAFLFRLALILILVASSVVMAPTRGAMAGLSQIEICGAAGTETVTLDARGNPVGPHHPCPDCIACHTAGLLAEPPATRFGGVVLRFAYPVARDSVVAGILAIHPTARGPPLSA